MICKSLLIAVALALSPAAFAATATPVVPLHPAMATTGKTTTTQKPAHKSKHTMLVKKQNAKMSNSVRLPATKA
jgi:hypothetical protein